MSAMDLQSKERSEDSRLQPGSSRGRGSQKLGALLQRRDSDSDDEADQFPRAVAAPMGATPKASLVGVQITDDDETPFSSRQHAMAAMIGENPKSAFLLPPHGSGRHQGGHTMLQINASSRLPSGLLYPCNSEASNTNSCLLNAAHFTFDSAILAPDQSNNDLTERIFKKLIGQSRQQKQQRDASKSPNSTLDCPASPASSERSFRGKSTKKSLRCRSEDANKSAVAAHPRPKSQLAQYLRSMTALSGDRDEDLEGPSEAAWLDPDSPYHHQPPCNKKLETWSSNSSSWNLSLNPLKTIVGRRGGTPRRASGSRFRKDLALSSLTGSYDGSRALRKGVGSDVSSGRSWWSEIGSGRKSTSIWACSGRSQAEADLHEPEMTQRVVTREVEPAKVDEAAFPFNNPIASSFVFPEGEKSSPADRITLHKSTISGTDSDDLAYSDTYRDPEDGSVTDCSDTLSWDRDSGRRSFDCAAHSVLGLSSRGMSGRVLSGFFDVGGRSGRFSVDLNRGQKLDKAPLRLPTPDVRLRVFASGKSSKRSILSPCLPFLQKSPYKNVPRIEHEPSLAASSRRIQAVNSFTARLGPVAESPTLAGQFHVQ